MNILFTCAGRRNYLINYFKEALDKNGKVIAVDNQLSAPALVDADIAIKVPRITDENYIDSLLKIIKDNSVTALISLNDLELPILALNKKKLEQTGAKIIISDQKVIDISFDKWKTYQFFKKINVETPKTYLNIKTTLEAILKLEINYPLIVKPRWGSASIGIDVANNEEELVLAHKLQLIRIKSSILSEVSSEDIENSIIIQEKINGDEYGIDILNDLEGNHYGSFVRKKLAMRSGETDKAMSIIDKKFNDIAKHIASETKHIGNMDCDFFVSEDKVYFLEMNPRFGGGYPFSHEAGINTPAIYIEWLSNNKDVDQHNNFLSNITFSKCDRMMRIPNHKM